MSSLASQPQIATASRILNVGCVSYLNAKPLIYGLDHVPDLRLKLAVPSQLIEDLRAGLTDIALLPVIDYQRLDDLVIVPAGGIGCFGHTLTVRLFSHEPIAQIKSLACDPDSHTSVALARIILAEHFGIHPQFTSPLTDLHRTDPTSGEARLLIGDKVICEEPAGFAHQLDLGDAWKQMTGLPFVFAVWTARKGVDLGDLPERLESAKRAGLEHVDDLVTHYALPRGWPAGMALQYMTSYLKYDIGEPQLQAIRRFHELAAKHELIPNPPRELVVYSSAPSA